MRDRDFEQGKQQRPRHIRDIGQAEARGQQIVLLAQLLVEFVKAGPEVGRGLADHRLIRAAALHRLEDEFSGQAGNGAFVRIVGVVHENPRPGALARRRGQQGRVRVGVVQVFHDDRRFVHGGPVVLERRHLAVGVDGQIVGRFLLTFGDVNVHLFVCQALFGQHDADLADPWRHGKIVQLDGGGHRRLLSVVANGCS